MSKRLMAGLIAVISLFVTCAVGEVRAAQGYAISEIAESRGIGAYNVFINDNGQIAMQTSIGSGVSRWSSNTGLVQLTLPSDTYGMVYAMNNSGQIAGEIDIVSEGRNQGVIWNGNQMTTITTYDGAARSINNNGVVAGFYGSSTSSDNAYVWDNGTLTELGNWRALGINDSSVVVGTKFFGDEEHAVIWNGTAVTDIGRFGGDYAAAMSINKNNEVFVLSGTKNGGGNYSYIGYIWDNGDVTCIGEINDGVVNDLGQVVGRTEYINGVMTGFTAYIWDEKYGMVDLNTLLPADSGWQKLLYATDINNLGQIVGIGKLNDGTYAPFLMTPVPEPGMMILLGLAAMILRRKGW